MPSSHDEDARARFPLAIDLDGTLIKSDTLHEGVVGCIKAHPLEIHGIAQTLRKGKAAFKRAVADRVSFDASALPYNEDVLSYLREQRRAGRRLGLFTAADQSIADAVAAHLGLFDVAVGSDGIVNASGTRKLDAIRRTFGDDFAYAGNDAVDAPIFKASRSVVLVGPVDRLRNYVPPEVKVEAAFALKKPRLRDWVRALRLEHWAKNSLVFVAPVLGFQQLTPLAALQVLILFVAMGLLASATYIVNDLFDLAADRQHPRKRFRPFAAGVIPVRDGLVAACALLLVSFGLALFLPRAALLALLAYLAVTLAYSLALKRQPIVDVIVLAGLFTLRVLAGSLLVATTVSPWLLSFSMLFFLGLAMVKRYAELERVIRSGGSEVLSRGYSARDLPLLLSAGVAAGFSSVVLFTIYLINDHYPRDIYNNPAALWGMMPILLLFVLRIWHLAAHGKMHEDPVVFALRDRFSLGLGGAMIVTLIAAWS
jgi:4-hydroxybenzoate polyprenyltransferase/phosphoserine phosphatase